MILVNALGSFIYFSIYSVWLCFSIVLALTGAFLPSHSRGLKAQEVKDSDTICRALYEKGKLTKEEYAFETDHVAESYDDQIFKGYSFIVFPVIWTLKKTNTIDSSILFLVHRWMSVHHHFFENKTHNKPPKFDIFFTKACVAIAKGTGKSLSLFD
jgi:hypothetical protein